jgi:hypothetical protein
LRGVLLKSFVDLLERAGWTFAQAFFAVIVANEAGVGLDALKVAGIAGGMAVAKFILVKADEYQRKDSLPQA